MLDNHNLQQQPEEVQLEEEEVEHREEVHEPPEYTTIVYQDKVGVRSPSPSSSPSSPSSPKSIRTK